MVYRALGGQGLGLQFYGCLGWLSWNGLNFEDADLGA